MDMLNNEKNKTLIDVVDGILDSDTYDLIEKRLKALIYTVIAQRIGTVSDEALDQVYEEIRDSEEYDALQDGLLALVKTSCEKSFDSGRNSKPVIQIFEMIEKS